MIKKEEAEKIIESGLKIVNDIKKHDYEPFVNIFWEKKSLNFKGMDFFIDSFNSLKNTTNNNLTDLQKINIAQINLNNLKKFHFIFFNNNVEFLKQIQEDILIPIEGGVYIFEIFKIILNLNKNISNNLYNTFYEVELFIKRAIVSIMIQKEKKINDVTNYNIKKIQKWKEIKSFKPDEDYKMNWKIFNVMSLGEIREFLEEIKSEEKNFLKTILKNILGSYKFEKIESGNTLLVKKYFLEHLDELRKLRNEIMHFGYILPTKKENILMEGIKSLIAISKSENGEADAGLTIHAVILNLTTRFLTVVNDKQILDFFQKNILSFSIY